MLPAFDWFTLLETIELRRRQNDFATTRSEYSER
jgi:hypothetical protein